MMLDRQAGESLVMTGDALVLVNDCQHRVPVRGAGERIMPGDDAFFAVAGRTIVRRQE